MAITKKIVEMMNGKLNVTSKFGKGTTFTVELNIPFIETKLNNDYCLIPIVENTSIYKQISHEIPATILVAEDNKVNQIIAKKFFKKLGYTIDIVENGLSLIHI